MTAAGLVVGGFEVGSSSVFTRPELRSEHAHPGSGVPAQMMVVVSADGKTFHAPRCRFIHDKTKLRTVAVSEALREGYAPCVRCMKKYLSGSVISRPASADTEAHVPGSEAQSRE